MRPIPDPRYARVFNRIPMDIIDMLPEVSVIPNQVLPITALPDAPLAPFYATARSTFTGRDAAGKPRLDQGPARFVIRIPLGKSPDAVQVIGQNHNCVDFERVGVLYLSECVPQQIDTVHQEVIVLPSGTVDGEEVGCACNLCSAVFCHPFLLMRFAGSPHPTSICPLGFYIFFSQDVVPPPVAMMRFKSLEKLWQSNGMIFMKKLF